MAAILKLEPSFHSFFHGMTITHGEWAAGTTYTAQAWVSYAPLGYSGSQRSGWYSLHAGNVGNPPVRGLSEHWAEIAWGDEPAPYWITVPGMQRWDPRSGHAYGSDLGPSGCYWDYAFGASQWCAIYTPDLSGPTVRQSATEDTCYTGWLEVDGDYGTTDVYIGRYLAGSLTVLATTRINAVVEGLQRITITADGVIRYEVTQNSPEIVPGTQSEDGIRAANDHTTLLTVTDTVITPEMGPYIGGRIWGGASNIIHELAGGALSAVKVADATYDSDTTWEVLIPVAEAPGTFEAVASTGETASVEVVPYEGLPLRDSLTNSYVPIIHTATGAVIPIRKA